MPYIPTETLLGGALLLVLVLAASLYPSSNTPPNTDSQSAKSKKKKPKKKTKPASAQDEQDVKPQPQVQAVQTKQVEPKAERKKLLAEKLLPKERKTRVDDMLAPEDRPAPISRVMRVAPNELKDHAVHDPEFPPLGPPVKVAKYEEDYASSASDDDVVPEVKLPKKAANDGWESVAPKKKKPLSVNISSSSAQQSTALPLPTSTKGQKKNAKKAELKKAQREEEEKDRVKRLASHKKDLERERINEIYSTNKSQSARSKAASAKATVTSNGHLIWD
ncbi:hypothetical protein B9479_000120 [Cryptococcus floricola]|uniref:Ribosome biogenesis protein NOP53 n=1 Tax=Cryptococcus floricola TaxID=2591691 RepID=A0A5D3B931_9TREE|nr:hypothetical protein B9479_000120 [Cryptococcus floricola]